MGRVGSREGLSWPGPPFTPAGGPGPPSPLRRDVTPEVRKKRRQELTAAPVHVCNCPTQRPRAGVPAERSRASDSKSSDLNYSRGAHNLGAGSDPGGGQVRLTSRTPSSWEMEAED